MEEEPLLEAVGGSLAATLSVTAFYPLEVLRVHLQKQHEQQGGGSSATDALAEVTSPERWKKLVGLWQRVVFNRGAGLRLVHTQVTSFLFYGLYRHITKTYFAERKGAWANVLASTSAAVLTVLMVGTPLDGIILRLQTRTDAQREATVEERPRCGGLFSHAAKLYNGVTPALLLCLNPAIHFTVYDYLKLAILNSSSLRLVTYDNMHEHALTAGQAFVVGALSKAIATIVCYPLLRAKVEMMTDVQEQGEMATTELTANSDFFRMFKTLHYVVRIQGLQGLYKGIYVHLLHTTMRSALSMVLREQLVAWLRKLAKRAASTHPRNV